MQRAMRLWELQSVDSDIDRMSAELGDVEAQLGETDELRSARDAVDQQRQVVHDLDRRQRGLEQDAQTLRAKIREIEDRLYSGKVTGIKEMQGFQEEVAHFKRRQSQIEDTELGVIDETEHAQAELKQLQATLIQVEDRWRADQAVLEARRDGLQASLTRRKGDRAGALQAVSAADVDRYESLRRRKHGRAVAKVNRNFCGSCRVELPGATLQRVRTSPEPVPCPSCERILAPA